jgi:RNA polymerase sigma factor (sigma-70 family)
MASGQLRAAIRQLLQRVSVRQGGGLSDGQLLERFARQRDEAAFETLLWRHGPMVLRTCRCLLRNAADAEDAFQATFLTLCRKAHTISNQESVGAWLYQVAYRTALRARAEMARHTGVAATFADVPAPEVSAHDTSDLRRILDEELGRLPEKYRSPVVLHYLEGKTIEQVAQELGWRPGTVSGRLARARALLRLRLSRRRLVLTSAALAGTLGRQAVAEACPAALLDATSRAAAAVSADHLAGSGALTARALGLARAPRRALALARVRLVGVALLLIGMVAAGTAFLKRSVDAPDGTVAAERGKAVPRPHPPEDEQRLSASGRVLDAAGNPVAGANVSLREWPSWQEPGRTGKDTLATTTTDTDGRFEFHEVMYPPFQNPAAARSSPWDVVAVAANRGLAWRHLTPRWQREPFALTLPAEGKIEGRLLGDGGRPVVGARVRVRDVAPLHHGPVSDQTPEEGILNLNGSQLAPAATSDAEGRFKLAGLPAGMRFTLAVKAPDYLEQTILAATIEGPQPNVVGLQPFASRPTALVEAVHTGAWEVTLQRGQRVRGRVRLEDSGRPAASVFVVAGRGGTVRTVADANGRFTLDGLPTGPCPVIVWPPIGKGDYLGASTEVELSAGAQHADLVLDLPRGTPVTGTVVDADTGASLAGVDVAFRHDQLPGEPSCSAMNSVRTDERGRFRLVVSSGKGALIAMGTSTQREQLTEAVTITQGEPLMGVRFALRRVQAIQGRVFDPQGEPVAGARGRLTASDRPGTDLGSDVTDAAGGFHVKYLMPGVQYEWTVVHAGREVGGRVALPLPGDQHQQVPIAVRLQLLGTVTGRVLAADQTPVRGAALRLWANVSLSDGTRTFVKQEDDEASTDTQGVFRFAHLVPDSRYRYTVEVTAPGHAQLHFPEVEVGPGQTQALPEIVLVPATASVSGIVADSAGQPLANVRVSAVPRGPAVGGPPAAGPAGFVTGIDGRFTLDGLAPGTLELEVVRYVAGERVGPARQVRAEAGQRDVPITLPAGKTED